jgi:O-acetyl-ADP-ribose deacetylase (regulator of RNase III)
MATRYLLFDHDPAKTKVWQKYLGPNHPITIVTASVDAIPADIYVSPANGYGQLDGGIDKVYRTMFPGIQTAVNDALRPYAQRKPPLGVGSALIVSIPNRATQLLLAPTMDLPTKLKTSWNAFWAALAIFTVTSTYRGTIAIPGLGTGTGHLEAKEMIQMVELAWRLSQHGRYEDLYTEGEYVSGSRLMLPDSQHDQPMTESMRQRLLR